jgi:hypothetical protein
MDLLASRYTILTDENFPSNIQDHINESLTCSSTEQMYFWKYVTSELQLSHFSEVVET